jgi:hypothetical protein
MLQVERLPIVGLHRARVAFPCCHNLICSLRAISAKRNRSIDLTMFLRSKDPDYAQQSHESEATLSIATELAQMRDY